MRYSILIAFLGCCAVSSLASPAIQLGKETDFKRLSTLQKLGVFALTSLQPEKHGNLPSWKSIITEEESFPFLDLYYIDIRSLLTQAVKLKENAIFPDLDYFERGDLCLPFCHYYGLTLKTGNTHTNGQERTTSVNEITPTTFQNTFTVPSFVWESPDFLFQIHDEYNEVSYIYRNLRIVLNNFKYVTTFDYNVDPDLGLQISNMDIKFTINWLRITIWIVGSQADGGWFIPLPPVSTDWTLSLRSAWSELKDGYIELLQTRINCVLSNYRVDPERCGNGTRGLSDKYHQMNVVELFETIGLGALDRP